MSKSKQYEYKPTSEDIESTEIDVICTSCGKKVDQICETVFFTGGSHKKCSCC